MKWLLIVSVVLWALFYVSFRAADRPGDDFGVLAWLMGAIALAHTLVYLGIAAWTHRLW